MIWIALVLIIGLGHMSCGQTVDQIMKPCDKSPPISSGPNVPNLPTLPKQFKTHVEANIVQKNMTVNLIEYYDYTWNRGMIETYDIKTNERVRTILNFNDLEARVIYENKTCNYFKTNSSSKYSGYMSAENGSHIKTIKDLLYFGADKGEVFVDGDKRIRGIAVNHWTTCVQLPMTNGTFTLDYFFSKGSGYFIDGAEIQVPVRAEIRGTGKSRNSNGSLSDEVHTFYHIYEFYDFKPGPIKDTEVFEIPVGVICDQGEQTRYDVPDISDHFSAGLEKVFLSDGEEVDRQSLQLYSDVAAQIYRLDSNQALGPRGDGRMPNSQAMYGNRPLTYINDFKNELVYVIDKLEKNCTVSKIVVPQGHEKHTMSPPSTFLDFFRDFSSFIYQGKKTWRGLSVYSWGFYNTSSKEITEILFHQPQSGLPKPPHMNQLSPVGIYKRSQAEAAGPELVTYEHMFGFSNGHPDAEIFDVSACYAMDHHSTFLALDVTGQNARKIIPFYQKEFISEIRQTIAGAAKVSGTRIASIKWEDNGFASIDQTMLVTFELLDNKLSGLESTVDTGPTLAQAITNLQQAINTGNSIDFDLHLATNIKVGFSIIGGSLWEIYSPPMSQPQDSSIQKYGAASMAGLAVGMLTIGALLGLLAAYVIYKRIDTSVPYKLTD